MLELTTTALLEKLEESNACKRIRERILNDEVKISDADYEMACEVFNETSREYFQLGFKTCFSLVADIVMNHQSEV